ncbi:MAG TPA: DUF6132 family protein [Polyangiaceae bacterium]|nr:DUF6132 family protein [Polyangiaceae bacterium]
MAVEVNLVRVPPPDPRPRGGSTAKRDLKKVQAMKLLLFVVGGAVTGFLYYRLVGCRSGACPITSSPIISTLYGAMIGLLLGRS